VEINIKNLRERAERTPRHAAHLAMSAGHELAGENPDHHSAIRDLAEALIEAATGAVATVTMYDINRNKEVPSHQ